MLSREEIGDALLRDVAALDDEDTAEFCKLRAFARKRGYTGTQLAEMDFGDGDQWRIKHFIPANASGVLVAVQKAGKSTILSHVIASLLSGKPLFGEFEVTKLPDGARIGIIDNELHEQHLQKYYRESLCDSLRVRALRGQVRQGIDLETERGRLEVATWVFEENIQFLLFDPLKPYVDEHGLDEWKDLGRTFQGLRAAAQRGGCDEILMVHHAGNQAETHGALARGRGDSSLAGASDYNINVSKGEHTVRKFDYTGRTGGVFGFQTRASGNPLRYQFDGWLKDKEPMDLVEPPRFNERELRVLHILRDGGEMTSGEIASVWSDGAVKDASKVPAGDALKDLAVRRVVVQTLKRGPWRIADPGLVLPPLQTLPGSG